MTILISFFTLVMGIIIARLSSNLIKRIIRETNSHKLIKNKFKKVSSLDKILPNLTRIIIYLITINLILDQQEINIKKSVIIFSILILSLILLSFKDLLPNIVVGIYLKLFKRIKLEETIRINDIEGKIKRISIFEVTILTKKKELISIPNIDLLKKL